MAIFNTRRAVTESYEDVNIDDILPNVDTSNVPDNFDEAVSGILYSNERNWNMLMQTVGIAELSCMEAEGDVIYEAADNKRLMQVLNNLREQIYRYRVEYLKEDESRNRLVKEHEKITRAIKERDVKAAQELSFEHLENQRMGIIQAIRAEE